MNGQPWDVYWLLLDLHGALECWHPDQADWALNKADSMVELCEAFGYSGA